MEESVIADSAASCNSNRDNDEVSLASDASRHTIYIVNSFLKYEATTAAATAAAEPGEDEFSIEECADTKSFLSLRFTYLIVTLVIMLADGLQGTANVDFLRRAFLFNCSSLTLFKSNPTIQEHTYMSYTKDTALLWPTFTVWAL